jgi:hypothetical protein
MAGAQVTFVAQASASLWVPSAAPVPHLPLHLPPPVFPSAPQVHHDGPWERRDLLGVHPQRQPGLNWVGACVPAGRLHAADFDEIARVAETYGDGTVRVTCEENVLFVNVPDAKLPAMLAEPLFQRFKVNAGLLLRGLVSCTGEGRSGKGGVWGQELGAACDCDQFGEGETSMTRFGPMTGHDLDKTHINWALRRPHKMPA